MQFWLVFFPSGRSKCFDKFTGSGKITGHTNECSRGAVGDQVVEHLVVAVGCFDKYLCLFLAERQAFQIFIALILSGPFTGR